MNQPANRLFFPAIALIALLSACSAPPSPEPSPSPPPTPSPSPSVSPDPHAAATQRQRGLELRQQERFPEAIAALEQAVALAPEHLDGRVLLGWTLHLAGERPAAARVLEAALERDRDYVPALNALGIVYLTSDRLEDAIATHERAAALKPDNEIAYYNLSLAYHRQQDYDTALARGERAAELEPSNPHPRVALALIHWERGETAAAQERYQQAIALDGRYRDRAFLDHLIEAGFSSAQVETTAEILAAL